MKKCQYRISCTTDMETVWFHYDTAIEAVHAWDKFKDDGGAKDHRTIVFFGAAGEMEIKSFRVAEADTLRGSGKRIG